jgi:multisubunit Na+/H+ antiporter MnhG subunit
MLQIALGFTIIFIYPFLSKMASQILMAIAIILSIIPFFILSSQEWGSYILICFIILGIGVVFRHFVQKAKYNSEAEKLKDEYKDKTD